MPFQSALTLTSVRGASYAGHQLIALCPNLPVLSARINQASFPDDGFAQITYDGATGDYTDVQLYQTVLISRTNDPRAAYWTGRVRKTPTSTVLYINETSADFADNDYIFVIDDYRLHRKEARPSGNTVLKDYDLTYAALPPVITGLTINDVKTQCGAGVCDPDTGELELAFSASAIAATSGASVASYAYTLADGMTEVDGDKDSASVVISFEPGWYWLRLTVTDSGARSTTLRIIVVAVPSDYSSVVSTGFSGAQIEGDVDNGFSANVNAFEGIDSVLDNTACVIFEVNDAGGNLDGNVKFVGRLRTEANESMPDEVHSRVLETRFTLEGTGDQLARVKTQPYTIEIAGTANEFDEVVNLTYWRAAAHLLHWHSTFFTLFTLNFSDTSNDSIFLNWGIGGGDLLSELTGIAEDWAANFEMAHDGRCQMIQRGTSLGTVDDDTDRAALPTIAALSAQDGIQFTLNREHVPTVGLVEAGGGRYNTSNGKVKEYLSRAPGIARGEGADDYSLPGQVLPVNGTKAESEAELNRRAGHALAEQNPSDELTVIMPDGYDFLIPSRGQWVTWTLSEDDLNLRGISYTTSTRWMVTQVNYSHSNDTGSKEVSVTFRRETIGTAGETQAPPKPGEGGIIIPSIPPITPYPSFPPPPEIIFPDEEVPTPYIEPPVLDGIPIDGNAVILITETMVQATRNYLMSGSPIWNDITPDLSGGWMIRDAGPKAMGQIRDFYVLVSNGTDSKVFYTENPFLAEVVWTEGETVNGDWDCIEVSSTPGSIYLYNADSGTLWEDVDDDYWLSRPFYMDETFHTTGNTTRDFTFDRVYPGAVGILLDSTARSNSNIQTLGSPSSGWGGLAVLILSTSGGVFVEITDQKQGWLRSTEISVFPDYPDVPVNPNTAVLQATTTLTVQFGGNVAGRDHDYHGRVRLVIDKSLEDPPDGPSGTPNICETVFSDDFGATWSPPVNHGNPPGIFGGVSAVKIGDLLLAGTLAQVAETDSGGGTAAYGDPVPANGQPNALLIPRYVFGSSASNATSTPDFLMASAVVNDDDETLWKVTADGTTFTDITPEVSSNFGVATGSHCLAMPWFSSSVIAAVLEFAAARRLMVSTNGGASWGVSTLLSSEFAQQVTFRKGDLTMRQLFGADGTPFYSPNRGATLVHKSYPGDQNEDPVLAVCVYG